MPLAAEYTWAESESFVQLQVPLRGRAKSTVDVFATECYVKISFPPYLLELDIDRCIDSAQHKARVEKGILVVKLKKKSDSFGIWGSLGQRVDRKCDPKVTARREQSIKEKLKWEEELKERISLRKHHDERLSLRSQMGVDEAERRLIDDIKAEEKEKAEAEVYRTFADLAAKQSRRHSPTAELLLPAPVEQPKQVSSGGEKQHALLSPPLASTTVSERRSSGGPLGTIPEEVSEEVSTDGGNSPTPAVSTSVVVERTLGGPLRTIPEEYSGDEGSPVPVASNAAAAKVADRSIWKETIGSDEPAEADEHRFEEPEGGGSDANNVVLNPPAQDAGQDEIRENTLASDDDGVVSYVPAPRVPAGVIPIGFSTRLFPTPLRESKVADESAWIMKNRRHLHKNKTLVGRLPSEGEQEKDGDINFDISESDPVWLKGKGDDLYRGGDFLGAINAYTAALEADPKAAACLSNRAACHLRLDQISACVADCGAALEIFRTLPETGPNQARVLVRRSLAYRELGHYKLSLNDCRAALGFNPGDTVLQRETARAEPLALCEAAKKEAVAHFASGNIAGACELYTAALAAVPAFPSCLSNRAVCYLALGKPQDCVRDCTAVLDMLSAGPSAAGLRANARRSDPPPKDPKSAGRGRALVPPPGSMPPPGSVKRRRWVLTTMLRRARANVQLGCLESALQDYRAASSLAPGDKAIEGDVRELERQLNSDAERRPLTH